MTGSSAASAQAEGLDQPTATAAVPSPGWQLLERLRSAYSISQLKELTVMELEAALYRSADTNVTFPRSWSPEGTAAVSWCSRRDQQLLLLFTAASNLLQLYTQSTKEQDAWGFEHMVTTLLHAVSGVVSEALPSNFCVDEHLPVFQQREQLPGHLMAVVQVLQVIEHTGEVLLCLQECVSCCVMF